MKTSVASSMAADSVEFPEMSFIVNQKIAGGSHMFKWGKQFMKAIDSFTPAPAMPSWTGVQVCTEFSGTGCAETAFQSAAHHLGLDTVFRYAADIDGECRKVLTTSFDSESCVFGDILELLPQDLRTSVDEMVEEKAS